MVDRKEMTAVMLDSKTKNLLDQYGKETDRSRSSVIRYITREFFKKAKKVA